MTTRVLVLAYQFPPIGGPAAQRAVGFVRHLPENGYEPIVLTGAGSESFWAPRDPAVAALLPADVEIHRVETVATSPRRERFERLLALRGSFGRQFEEGACRIARRFAGRVDVLLAELGPYQLSTTARRLARDLDVPLVVDLHDPWALDEMWMYPTGAHRLIDRRRMHALLSDATAVVMNTHEASRRLLATFSDVRPGVVWTIPCGFDASDFEGPDPPRGSTFRIVHTGSLHTQWGMKHRRTARIRRLLGGLPIPGVDVATRSHVFLLEAINELMRENSTFATSAEVHFAGAMTDADRSVAAQLPITRVHGFRPHREVIRFMREADLLFLPMQNLPSTIRAGLVPAKTYEYAASGRPILAAVPEGDVRMFLKAVGTATVVEPDDIDGIKDGIATAFERWQAGGPESEPAAETLAQHEYGHLTERLASVLSASVRGGRGVPER